MCTSIYTYIYMFIRMDIHTYKLTCRPTYLHMYIYTSTHTLKHICTYTCTSALKKTCTYTYTRRKCTFTRMCISMCHVSMPLFLHVYICVYVTVFVKLRVCKCSDVSTYFVSILTLALPGEMSLAGDMRMYIPEKHCGSGSTWPIPSCFYHPPPQLLSRSRVQRGLLAD